MGLKIRTKVADEVWLVVALLHREHPKQPDFTIEEIMERAAKENIGETLRPGVYVHIVQHCVANRAPNPGRYRMLFETASSRRRLFRQGDSYHPLREGSKTTPEREDLPEEYRNLLDWYQEWARGAEETRLKNDALMALYGSGKDLWADEHADEYVRRLREDWE
ncbi:MAG: hypothetical protein NVS1B11_07110 [Terriglobales bacterium]